LVDSYAEGSGDLGESVSTAGLEPISAAFGSAVSFVIDRLEGGASLISDSGGETKFGISKRGNPGVDISHLSREEAIAIYHEKYWSVVRGDALPRGLDLLVFDAAVNMGPIPAVRLLQRILSIREDGMVGPQTIAAVKAFSPQSELRALYNELRHRVYTDLCDKKPAFEKYRYGWSCRMFRLADEAGRVGGKA
jgi:lysozyme family protein